MAGLSALPAELQIEIFGYLNSKDLKTVRALCRKCNGNASPTLFARAIACTRYQALSTLRDISQHAVLRKYVKEIVFDGSVYDASIAANEAQYGQLEDKYVNDAPGNLFHKRGRYRRYRDLYADQEEIRTSLILLHELARALDSLQSVTTLTYSPGPHHVPKEAKVMRDLLPRGINDHTFYGNIDGDYIDYTQGGIHHVVGAIHQSQTTRINHFRVLPVDKNRPGNEFTAHVFDFPDPKYIDSGKFFFRHLHKVELHISLILAGESFVVRGSNRGSVRTCLANLGALLAEAVDLQELSFSICHWSSSPHKMYGHVAPPGQPLFPYLGLDRKWSKLQKVNLCGIYATEGQILELLRRHAETLGSAQFQYCSLVSGTWANIVDEALLGLLLPFSIYRVNEIIVGGRRFEDLGFDEMTKAQYSGQIRLDGNGNRFFDEPRDSTVYASREHVPRHA